MNLETEHYSKLTTDWPQEGRVILAQFDADSIVVYQAYRPEIGNFAVQHGYFGGQFKLTRMSWIKPNFLWMMYRSGWGTKQGQEIVLAVRIKRSAFDELLRLAVHSSYKPAIHESREAWKSAVSSSSVRLQWDPDHSPNGDKLERRAIQLGLRGNALEHYSRDWILEITDVSELVDSQRKNSTPAKYSELIVPRERVYPVSDQDVIDKLRLQHFH